MAIKSQQCSCSVYIPKWPFKGTAAHVSHEANLHRTLYRAKTPGLNIPAILHHSKAMCLLIITSHSHCGHNTYRHGRCSENTAYLQCPEKRTELGTFDGKCPACDGWAALAWRTWEERISLSQEKNVAAQAEQQRRRSTLWQDHHPLRDTAQSTVNGSPQVPSWREW